MRCRRSSWQNRRHAPWDVRQRSSGPFSLLSRPRSPSSNQKAGCPCRCPGPDLCRHRPRGHRCPHRRRPRPRRCSASCINAHHARAWPWVNSYSGLPQSCASWVCAININATATAGCTSPPSSPRVRLQGPVRCLVFLGPDRLHAYKDAHPVLDAVLAVRISLPMACQITASPP